MEVDTIHTTFSTPANCRDGPRFERGITDCFCCILYILFCLTMVTVFVVYRGTSVTGYEKPFDYDHQPCIGVNSFLYIPTADLTKTVCVERCPNQSGQHMPCRVNSHFPVCPTSTAGLIADKGHHLCHHQGLNVNQLTGHISMKNVADAVIIGRREILVTAGVTAALALVLLITTFIFPELMTWLYLIMFQLLLAAISVGFFYRYFRGKLPFVDSMAPSSYQSNVVTLIIAIVFAVAFVLSLIILLSKISRIQFVVTVLKIARRCLWENMYMLLISFILSAISVIVLAVNLLMFYTASSSGHINPLKHGPYDQFQYDSSKWWWPACLLMLYLWSRGLMIAISDFLYEGFAIYWYFNQRVYGYSYSRCTNFTNTIKLLFWHFGTTCMGAIPAYIPEIITSTFNQLQYTSPRFYSVCCCCHKYLFRYLSKYSYIQTILQSYSFCAANQQLFYLRRRVKQQVPQLYMRGNFYQTAAKTFLVLASIVVCYILLITNQPQHYHNVFNLLSPLIITAFISNEIATHFMNCTGLIGDTLVFMYCIDLEIQRYRYGSTEAYSCPNILRPLIKQSKLVAIL